MADISVTISNIKFKNPTMLASGVLGETGASLQKVAKGGAGAIVTKSIGLEPREGHSNPTLIELDHGLLNAMGLPNPGVDDYRGEVVKALEIGIPVIGSIFGKSEDEFTTLAEKMEDYCVHAIELNLSCPHAEGYGAEIGQDHEKVYKITEEVKSTVSLPVFVKLTPNVTSVVGVANAAEKAGADGIVAINTVKAMAINAELGRPVLSNTIGGYSGPAIKPIGLRCVYEIKGAINIPIIGVGGITSGKDVIEYIMAGASAVQIGTGVYLRGEKVFKEICDEIITFMQKHGYNSLEEMIGLAQRI